MKPLESMLRTFLDLHPEDAAKAFETIEFQEALRLFRNLPTATAAALLERLTVTAGVRIIDQIEPERVVQLISAISMRQGAALVSHLEETRRQSIMKLLPERDAAALRELAAYPPESAGAMMETRVASLAIDLTAQQAISSIRKAPRDALHYLYVTNRNGELAGVLNMRDLLLASPRDPIEQFVKRELVSVAATMNQTEVISLMRERRFLALPVVDFDGRLVGVVKHSQALQASQEEAFQDLQKIVGAGADERALSPVSTVVKSRLPWLYVNLLTAFMAAAVVGAFEGIIAQVAALAVLMPVVAGQGGNTGSQSLAVIMRGIALREVLPGVKRRVILKETCGGLINGVAVALVTALAVFGWRLLIGDTTRFCTGLACVIGLAMVVNMVAAAAAGAAIPLLLKTLGRDPAQSASIFLTTVTDIVGLASFLGFAVVFSPLLL